jgi:hypothetical protein
MDEQIIKFFNKTFMLAAIFIVGVLVFFVGQLSLQNKSISQQSTYQITVSGEGKVYAKPDVALVSLGVTSQAVTVADATKVGTESMNAVIAAVKALNIDEKDIQTTNYSLTPVYEYENIVTPVSDTQMYSAYSVGSTVRTSKNTLKGYKLEQNVRVKIRDFTKIGDVLSKATASGANLVGDLQFTIDNPEQYKEQARAQAIAQAKTNAENLAKESGIGLGKLVNVYENYAYPTTYSNSSKMLGAGAADSAPAPTIQPGQQEIDVTINLTYKVN